MTKDEALAEALELLNCWVRGGSPEDYWQEIDTVADAVKDALEEQQSFDKHQPLTDDEIIEALMPVSVMGDYYFIRITRAIEAAHGIGKKT
jgi:hypothetical protein